MADEKKFITIPMSKYIALQEQAKQLESLEDYGVDDWEGYSDAIKAYRADKKERKKNGYYQKL